jgi:precorrin-2 dehydrogenase/sirohydrochlorin ferrochelatase
MTFLPVMINIENRKVVIFGGGKIAARKAKQILDHGGIVTAIATAFDSAFDKLTVDTLRIDMDASFEIAMPLAGAYMVIIATNNENLNDRIENECIQREILYNRVDHAESPLIFPASTEQEGVIISVSTLGKSPSFSVFLRDLLMCQSYRYLRAMPVIQKLRRDVHISDLHRKGLFFGRLFNTDRFWELIDENKFEEAYILGESLSYHF